jgi:SAM-dependent methyltransferase
MVLFADLLACPACRGELSADLFCTVCRAQYPREEGIARLRLAEDEKTKRVREFYEEAPFPGYPPSDSLSSLRARAERSDFMRRLDAAIPGDARIVEVGCGTGQTSLYLARADRTVVGADITRASLALATAAAKRFDVRNVTFVQTDLMRPGLRTEAFDVVYCSGVLHHTPDPRASFAHVAKLARPGGIIVLGLYNLFARLPLRLRRIVARATGYRFIPLDPVLKDRAGEPERRRAWLRDQYRHPLEHSHTLHEVQSWFTENGIAYLRAYPSALFGGEDGDLFAPAADNWRFEGWLSQMRWIASLGHEGGLFVVIGRRLPNEIAVRGGAPLE